MIEQASLVLGNGNWAVKSDSLLGYKTIDGKYYPREMSVVRATTGTRVNEAGLVEVVPYNLLNYSEEFDYGAWGKINVTITANTTAAPNGTVTADKLIATNTASAGRSAYQSFTPILNSIYTISVYVKAAEYTKFAIFEIANGRFGVSFDLVNQTTTLIGGLSYVSSLITDVGNGWFRCSVTANGSTVGWAVAFVGYPDVGASLNPAGVIYAGDGTSGVYIWGAQLVEGTQPLDYLPTTTTLNIPRIDYSTGSPALLLEPQRTNLALQSSSFDNATWSINAVTITANSNTSPSGVSDADTLTGDGASAQHRVRQFINFTNALTYTVSVYVKKNTNNFFQIVLGGGAFGNAPFANFDINNGILGSAGGSATSTITDVGNGWYRCTMSATATVTTSDVVEFDLITSSTSIRRETNTLSTSVFLWGAQLEAGSYATSYIPTTSASVTRNRDQCVKTGITDFIGQTEGTLFVNAIGTKNVQATAKFLMQILGSKNISITFYGGNINVYSQLVDLSVPFTPNQIYKIAVCYSNSGNFRLFVNGVKTHDVNTYASGTYSDLGVGCRTIGDITAETSINSAQLYKVALTDVECITLTTL